MSVVEHIQIACRVSLLRQCLFEFIKILLFVFS